MPVQTTRSPGDGDMCVVRRHSDCHVMTDRWWGAGCAPVCLPCAGMETVTDASMRALCRREGYGPIPTESTDLPAEGGSNPSADAS